MARLLTDSESDLIIAAKHMNEGKLVAFPTETVYGLGAHLEEESLKLIFAAKKRPYSDPLIVHFAEPEEAKKVVILTDEESELFDKLSKKFWPGPLTIIAPATNAIPPLVMAGTGCVGVRVPVHPISHRFLELCGEPVAAPSANLFGHVSPTTANHVKADLGNVDDLYIVEGGDATIGIESTVIRIQGNTITILRPGFITSGQLEEIAPGNVFTATKNNAKLASPGHDLKHYAPNMPTVLATLSDDSKALEIPSTAIMIDFNRTFSKASSKVLRYFDLSPIGSVTDATKNVYNILRDAELTQGATICIICDIKQSGVDDKHDSELITSLRDRLIRSASHTFQTYKL